MSASDASRSSIRGDVAIVGLACTYPGARRMEQFWRNIVNKVDAITDVDPDTWDPAAFVDPDPNAEDRLYSKKGGWIPNTFTFNPLKFGIPPAAVAGSEPDQFLLLRCAFEALDDAGYLNRDYNRERVSVIVGRGNYPGPGHMWLAMRSSVVEGVIAIMRHMRPDLSEDRLQRLRVLLKAKMPKLTPEGAGGLIPNITTGRAANRFDFMGQNYTVDAACASALIAATIAVRNLLTGVDDMTLIGGLHICSQVPFLSIFKVTRATSLTSVVRPFDENADGTLGGEGVGMLVLKRLADAERDGDRIYAVIKGVGSASDGKAKGVLTPRVEGEALAIRRALAMADIPPESIGLVECHGTATVVGDATEIQALESAYGSAGARGQTCAIGSVKSMIGHTMPAAGAASLIKTALALYHRVLPPTLNVTQPHPRLRDSASRFYVNSETKPWIQRTDGPPRRAGVNAFGFGGINVHVVMEEYNKADEKSLPSHLREWATEVVIVEGATREGLLEALERLREYVIRVEGVALRDVAYTLNTSLTGASHRAAIVASSLAELAQKIDRLKTRLMEAECTQIRERSGIYYFENPELRNGKLALLFPGEGAQYLNMMTDLCIHFPEVRKCFDMGDAAVKDPLRMPLSTLVYPPPAFSKEEEQAAEGRLWSLEHGTETGLTADWAMLALTQSLGIQPDMMTGHSMGDWLAMIASGILDLDEVLASMDRLDQIYQKVKQNTEIPKMTMLAVGAGRERILEIARQFHCEVEIANDNCPHQVVVVTKPEGSQAFIDHLLKSGVFVERLPYDGGYHTPSFTYMSEPLRGLFESFQIQAARLPVYCGMTAEPWPDKREEILDIASATYARPILFSQTIERMYRDGARIFVEAGPRGNLTAFVDDILRGKPHLTVPLDVFRRPGITALNHAVGLLAANSVPLDFNPLYRRRSPVKLSMKVETDSVLPEEREPGVMQVSKVYRYLYVPEGNEFPMPALARQPAPAQAEVSAAVTSGSGASLGQLHEALVQTSLPAPAAAIELPAAEVFSPRPTSPAGGSTPASIIDDHFLLMEEFLRTQEDIMSRVLRGGFSDASPAPPANDIHFATRGSGYLAQPLTVPSTAVSRNVQPPGAAETPRAGATPPVETPVVAAPAVLAPAGAAPGAPDPRMLLLQFVSERTGYPPEMLDLDQDMEADLGIDSIKRVEIFSALQQLGGGTVLAREGDMEAIGKLKTLRQMLSLLVEKSPAPLSKAPPAPDLIKSLIRTAIAIEETPGESLTLRLALDLNEHRYLRDHSLTFPATDYDNQGNRTYLMPLTGSIELSCETAALLDRGQMVVGVSGIDIFRSLQVIENEEPPMILVAAKRQASGEIRVQIRPENGKIYSQATVHLAAGYSAAPQPMEPALENPRAPKSPGDGIYAHRHMFHGPSFQGVRNIDVMADNGVLATLELLPTGRLLQSDAAPKFHIDPFLLDAAGQLVGYWPIENCQRGCNVLPIKVGKVDKYCENPPSGAMVSSRIAIRKLSDQTLLADYDVLLPDGRLWLRVTGWEDWRFYWTARLFDYAYGRFANFQSAGFPVTNQELEAAGLDCILVPPLGDRERDALSDENWAYVLFSKRELAEFRSLPPLQQAEWLFGRTSAKDAVRAYLLRAHDRKIFPADVEITVDRGTMLVGGAWSAEIPAPHVSYSYQHGWSVAAAGGSRCAVSAIEMNAAIPPNSFLPDEEDRLARLGGAEDWKRRAVIAKQAAGKYFCPDAAEDFWQSLVITKVDTTRGWFEVADPGSAVNAEDCLRVLTIREAGYLVAVAFHS
ncbi:MAG: polyketide synthase dehydratase domain-containing protein [Bryobacterales bacterium]|nr:polyketide synthase dehydratase domain-containing protein [Bryobacterales bacterium]